MFSLPKLCPSSSSIFQHKSSNLSNLNPSMEVTVLSNILVGHHCHAPFNLFCHHFISIVKPNPCSNHICPLRFAFFISVMGDKDGVDRKLTRILCPNRRGGLGSSYHVKRAQWSEDGNSGWMGLNCFDPVIHLPPFRDQERDRERWILVLSLRPWMSLRRYVWWMICLYSGMDEWISFTK